jgi:hypothetical protein
MAALTTSYVVKSRLFPSEKVKMVTTGQTRVGDMKYAQAHDNLVKIYLSSKAVLRFPILTFSIVSKNGQNHNFLRFF